MTFFETPALLRARGGQHQPSPTIPFFHVYAPFPTSDPRSYPAIHEISQFEYLGLILDPKLTMHLATVEAIACFAGSGPCSRCLLLAPLWQEPRLSCSSLDADFVSHARTPIGHGELRTPQERLPLGAPKKEFGRMIFEKKSSLRDRTKFRSTTCRQVVVEAPQRVTPRV